MQQRLLHYGTPVRIHTTRRTLWATPIQHKLLTNVLYHANLSSRQRALMIGCSQRAVVHNLRHWQRLGALTYKVEGRGRAARSTARLLCAIPRLRGSNNEPTIQRSGCVVLGKVSTCSSYDGLARSSGGPVKEIPRAHLSIGGGWCHCDDPEAHKPPPKPEVQPPPLDRKGVPIDSDEQPDASDGLAAWRAFGEKLRGEAHYTGRHQ